MLKDNGERQVGMMAGEREVHQSLRGISIDHQCRYRWVASKIERSDTILDAICGVGYGSYIMAIRHPKEIQAFDVCQDAIDYANKYYSRQNIVYHTSDCHEISFQDNYFSKIVCFEAIEHIERPEEFLSNLRKWLSPQGTLYISSPNETVNPFSKERYPFHLRHWSASEFEEMLNEAGFKVCDWFSQRNKSSMTIDNHPWGATMIAVCNKA